MKVGSLEDAGWLATPACIPSTVLERTAAEVEALSSSATRRGGARNLLDLECVRSLARVPCIRDLAVAALGDGCFSVRGLLFDKTPVANWKVAWHQDLTIAVREQRPVPAFGAWSEKAGVPHVQAPAAVLERMLAVRIHLDDCGLNNGPVRVLPGSHRGGRLTAEQITRWCISTEPVSCVVERGGILAFRPLLLHASSPATSPRHRRVVHLEFAVDELPDGLEWHARV